MADFPEIPGCEILSVLGVGGMAKVYLGIEESLDRKVAIKVLEPSLLTNKSTEKRFEKEAKTAANLRHSNIIPIFSTGKAGKYHYIIMEYLGESLIDRMKANPENKMNPQEAVKIVKEIMEALDYAHSKNVYHRDIKPDNILFREDGTPILVDFGIARVFDAPEQLTKSGQSMGTVYYMSPEQARAKKRIDGRTDIYSLGVVLYEMLTGKKPYKGDSYVSVALKQIEAPVPKLPPIMGHYQPLIDKMMAKDRKKRISSKVEFLEILDNISDSPVRSLPQPRKSKRTTHPDTDGKPLVKPEEKLSKKYPLKKTIKIVSLVVLVIVLVLLGADQIKDSEQKKEQQSQDEYKLAYQYLEEGNYAKAEALLKELKKIKDTQEVKWLERNINQSKDTRYEDYLTNTKFYLLENDFLKSEENLSLAKQLNHTPEVDTLEKRIVKTKKRRDDLAYKRASSKNTIAAYQKYLEEFPYGRHDKEAASRISKFLNVPFFGKRKVKLRSQYKSLNIDDITSMIKKNNFFERNLNKSGMFQTRCEKYRKNDNHVVIDRTTELMWYDGPPSRKEMKFSSAEKWIRNLNKNSYWGYNDWRLPTLEEAASLLRKSKNKDELYINSIFSGNQQTTWTKDHYLSSKEYWVVDFQSGIVKVSTNIKKEKYQVRAVRSYEGGTPGSK